MYHTLLRAPPVHLCQSCPQPGRGVSIRPQSTEAQRGEDTCPGSHSQGGAEIWAPEPAVLLLPGCLASPAPARRPPGQLRQPRQPRPDVPGPSWFHNHPPLYPLKPQARPRKPHTLAAPPTQGQPRSSTGLRGPVLGSEDGAGWKRGGGVMPKSFWGLPVHRNEPWGPQGGALCPSQVPTPSGLSAPFPPLNLGQPSPEWLSG